MKFLKYLTEIIAWIQIAASPFLAGLVIGGIVYLAKRDALGLTIAMIIVSTGLIAGIVWATNVWRKKGTVNFMGRIIATPELNEKESQDTGSTN